MNSKSGRAHILAGFVWLPLLSGCASTNDMHNQSIPDSAYLKALEHTDPSKYDQPAPDSTKEAAMLQRVEDLFTNYCHENLSENTTKVYAREVYFRDAFKQLHTAEEIRTYFLEGLAPLEGAEFVFNRIIGSKGDYYLDWTMRLDFKKTPPGTWEESIGMTRMRFNSEGQIIFHQDYWDPTDIVYQRIPIAKQLIGYVKGKM